MGKYLNEKQRFQLEAYLKAGMHKKEIAKNLGCCLATVYNEIRRGTVELCRSDLSLYKAYCADVGQRVLEENQSNKGRIPIAIFDFDYLDTVEYLITEERLSPYAVVQKLKSDEYRFKHKLCETSIYNYIHKNRFRNRLSGRLPYRKSPRKSAPKSPRMARNHLMGKSIEDRAKSPDFYSQRGHWEIDTVYSGKGKGKECILVLTERLTLFEELYKLPDRTAKSVTDVLDRLEKGMGADAFRKKYRSFTSDNGVEFLDFKAFERSCTEEGDRTELYYCHSYCSWERAKNENQNKLIRRFVPKGSPIADYTDEDIKRIEHWMNALPRKRFNGECSATLYYS